MRSSLRIGIDFDNTIISYDDVFRSVAKRCGLIDPEFSGSKQAVRDAIRLLPDGELAWQRLQGQVYGKGIAGAKMVPGVEAFLRHCRAEGCTVAVVSHKTEYGHFDPYRVNLRTAALDWMAGGGLVGADRGVGADPLHRRSSGSVDRPRFPSAGRTHPVHEASAASGGACCLLSDL